MSSPVSSPAARLRALIADPRIVIAPGVYDPLGAMFADRAGFDVVYVSGAAVAYTRFGRPDIGLVSMSEMAQAIGAISERLPALPLLVDADTGFGNALNVVRTVQGFERAGAAGVQLEDQTLPKRCGHLQGKTLVSAAEMVGKIKAACDARRDAQTVIVARTDAIAVEGLEPALERAERYAEAGADLLFVEAPGDIAQLKNVCARFAGRRPIMANMVEGGKTPVLSGDELQAMGFDLAIFPGGLVRAFAHMATDYFETLRRHGTTQPFRNRMYDFSQFNELLGTADVLEHGKRYDASNYMSGDKPPRG